ncbi:MAG: hypothetical protein HKN19_10430 [Halioglobus sp.]|nr:hypothetical protein [Halioglobus sp.]
MTRLHQLIFLGACGVFLCGCGGKEPEGAASVEDALVVDVEQAEADIDPCDLVTEDFIRARFEIATEATISRRLSEYSVHPMCVVSWRKPDAAEIEAKTAAAMSDYLERKMRGEQVQMPSFATEDEVTVTLFQPQFEDNATAIASFDQAMSVLQRGVKGKAGGVDVSFRSDIAPVEGVGDKASWAVGIRQLSVVQGTRIYYITVNTGSRPSVEEARALAVAKGIQELL